MAGGKNLKEGDTCPQSILSQFPPATALCPRVRTALSRSGEACCCEAAGLRLPTAEYRPGVSFCTCVTLCSWRR